MNVNPGGSQLKMHDTIWDGKVQKMMENGIPKGMRRILEERGVDVSGLKACDMRNKLKDMADFKYEKAKVETYCLRKHIHRCIFLLKYHCELNL